MNKLEPARHSVNEDNLSRETAEIRPEAKETLPE